MLTFEKKKVYGGFASSGSNFRVYVYKHKGKGAVHIIFRLARVLLDEAGWFVGDHAIPSYDEKTRQWILTRTSDRSKGYMVTSTDKMAGPSVYLKFTIEQEVADAVLPGGACDCEVASKSSREIVGAVRS